MANPSLIGGVSTQHKRSADSGKYLFRQKALTSKLTRHPAPTLPKPPRNPGPHATPQQIAAYDRDLKAWRKALKRAKRKRRPPKRLRNKRSTKGFDGTKAMQKERGRLKYTKTPRPEKTTFLTLQGLHNAVLKARDIALKEIKGRSLTAKLARLECEQYYRAELARIRKRMDEAASNPKTARFSMRQYPYQKQHNPNAK